MKNKPWPERKAELLQWVEQNKTLPSQKYEYPLFYTLKKLRKSADPEILELVTKYGNPRFHVARPHKPGRKPKSPEYSAKDYSPEAVEKLVRAAELVGIKSVLIDRFKKKHGALKGDN
ncbi:MAG: hypothetical protein ACOH5I_22000 [Oligoflexus sp.]